MDSGSISLWILRSWFKPFNSLCRSTFERKVSADNHNLTLNMRTCQQQNFLVAVTGLEPANVHRERVAARLFTFTAMIKEAGP